MDETVKITSVPEKSDWNCRRRGTLCAQMVSIVYSCVRVASGKIDGPIRIT